MKKRFLAIVAITSLVLLTGLVMLGWFSQRPANLGVHEGRLGDCPDSPNCISTRSSDPRRRMDPITFRGSPSKAFERLLDIVQAMPRSQVVEATDGYLHAEFTSLVFRFVDDVEFLIDEDRREIHFRSASRVGYSDLGANRARMVKICKSFEKTLP